MPAHFFIKNPVLDFKTLNTFYTVYRESHAGIHTVIQIGIFCVHKPGFLIPGHK